MWIIIITAIITAIITIWVCKKCFGSSKPTKKYDDDIINGIIYMLDSDFDTKFSLMDLISPKINCFDTPLKTCQLIKKVPDDVPIKLIISTKGGSLVSVDKIIRTLKKHKTGYVAFVCQEAYSAGAILALGANEIIMGESSYIGKIDPQLNEESVINYVNMDGRYKTDRNICKVRECEHVLAYMDEILECLFKDHKSYPNLQQIKEMFIYSKMPHCKLFDAEECKKIGLNVRSPTPDEMKYVNLFDD